MKNIFFHTSYTAALDAVMEDISRRKADLKRRHIVIVPDRCTLTAERALCDKLGGAFDAYVTTWSRLTGSGEGEYLPRKGSVMLVRSILAACRDKLKCYSRSWDAKGFASRMYDVISQLAVCDISPETIAARGDVKSEDIALIYSEYMKATGETLTDASGRMIALARTLEHTDIITNAVVYVVCFDAYTTLMTRVLGVMENKAIELRMYETVPEEWKFGEVELYASPATASAAKAIAARIVTEHRNGVSYDDMCVVTAALHPDELVRIFRENGVPYCATEGLTLAEHPLGVFLSGVITAKTRGYRPDDVIRLAKNAFSGVDKKDCDALERFVRRRGITYKLFLSPFEKEGAGSEYYERAEAGRSALASLLERMEGEGSVSERLEHMIDYAEQHYAQSLAEADEGRASPITKARELTALCGRLLAGVPDNIALDAFCEGMRETELSARPRLRGAVEIGSERDFRARRFSRVFVADFDSDTHPAVTSDDGLISDSEINELRESGAMLSPTTAEVNKRAADEFFLLLSGAEKIMLVYSEKAGDVLDVIKRGACSFTETSWAREEAMQSFSHDPYDLIKFNPTENMITERYLAALSEAHISGDEPYWLDYARKLSPDAGKWMLPDPVPESASAGNIMMGKTTGVTQLEVYGRCPRRHYFSYGLKLRTPEEAELSALDIGNILHEVAEKYVSREYDTDVDAAVEKLLTEALKRVEKNREDNERIMRLLFAEAKGLCCGIRNQIEAGSFRPSDTEAVLGENGKYKGLTLDAGEKKVLLRGKIDRIDLSEKLVRLIDYKTGSVSCELKDVRVGVKLQLLLYLAAMKLNGYVPAGAFYLSTRSDFSTKQPYSLVGFCVNSDEVLDAMDPCILSEGKSGLFQVRNGKNKRPKVCFGESGKQLDLLMDYAQSEASEMAKEISEGYIYPSPYEDSCSYCEYADCCGYGGASRRCGTPSLPDDKEGPDVGR